MTSSVLEAARSVVTAGILEQAQELRDLRVVVGYQQSTIASLESIQKSQAQIISVQRVELARAKASALEAEAKQYEAIRLDR